MPPEVVEDKPYYRFDKFTSMPNEDKRSTVFASYSTQRRSIRAQASHNDKENDFAELLVSKGDNPIESETIFEEVEVPERYEKELLMSTLMTNVTASEVKDEDLDEELQSAVSKELDDQLSH
ncbi:hypothetical protein Tcan_03375 [Toxocara canis]|nr:hypothetical protein Tcan_03375 [Toxocara canis]